MARCLLLAPALLAFFGPGGWAAEAGSRQLGPAEPEIVLLTMGPDHDVLFREWGHAALCVDDRCFNYGVTDFSRPVGLVREVLRGEAVFWVAVSDYRATLEPYFRADRSVFRQELALSREGRDLLLARLAADLVPGQSEYVYDHFADNCTTRIRDYLNEATGGALEAPLELPEVFAGREGAATWRTHIRRGLTTRTLLLWLTDLGLGSAADAPVSAYEAMFLPAALRHGVEELLGAAPIRLRRGPDGDRLPSDPGSAPYVPFVLGLAALFSALILVPGLPRVSGAAVVAAPILLAFVGVVGVSTIVVSPLPLFRSSLAFLAVSPADFLLGTRHRRWYGPLRLLVGAGFGVLLLGGWSSQPLGGTLLAALLPVGALVFRDLRKRSG